jgi:hypothetical protein
MGPQEFYRVWRLRKQNLYVDAQLRSVDEGDAAAVEIRLLYNGELSYKRVCPTREAAIAEAAAKRAELEREGWIPHW